MLRFALCGVTICAGLGCGIPHDPGSTFDRVRRGTMRVGITQHEPWTRFADGRSGGIEAELIQAFADQLGSQVQWVPGAEAELLEALHRRELDLVIGGLKASTPWAGKIGLTRPYVTTADEEHVLAVPPGENRWLLELQRFLNSRAVTAERRLETEPAS